MLTMTNSEPVTVNEEIRPESVAFIMQDARTVLQEARYVLAETTGVVLGEKDPVEDFPQPESMLDEAKALRFLTEDIRRRLIHLRCGLLDGR